VVSHVLVYHSSCNINRLIIRDLQQNLAKTFQGLLELICLVVHQSKMEPTRHKVFLKRECRLVHFNCHCIQLVQALVMDSCLLEEYFCLPLICKTFTVPKLSICGCDIFCSIVVIVGEIELLFRLPIQIDVSSIEEDGRVVGIKLDSLVKVCLGILQAVDVVVCQTSIVIMHGRLLNLDGLAVVDKSFLKFTLFEVGKTQVVMDTWPVILHFNCLFQIFDGLIKVFWAQPPETDTFVEPGLVLMILLRDVLESLCVIVNSFLHLVKSRLYKTPVVEILTVLIIVLDGQVVMLECLIELSKLIVLHSRHTVVLSEYLGVLLALFCDSNSHRIIIQGSLEITHEIITVSSHFESL